MRTAEKKFVCKIFIGDLFYRCVVLVIIKNYKKLQKITKDYKKIAKNYKELEKIQKNYKELEKNTKNYKK